jgi:CopG family nickel-responsive transcriptional regulator
MKFIKFLMILNKINLSRTCKVNKLVFNMTIISISVPEKLLERVETSIKEEGFANRSEIVRQALRTYIMESRKLKELDGEIAATITMIYERGITKGQISEIQHSFGNIISTFLHTHISEDYCIEVIVVNGQADTIIKLVEAFRTNECINQIKIAILKTPRTK